MPGDWWPADQQIVASRRCDAPPMSVDSVEPAASTRHSGHWPLTRRGHFARVTEDFLGPKKDKAQLNQKQHEHLSAMCQCGKVRFETVGPPILTGSCYCTSCQEAGRRFERLASAPPVLDPDSGTGLILYRKDRVQCVMGQQYLQEHRLKPDSPTRRIIANCCNSAMFLDFTKGHWLSMFRNRFPAGAPPLEMRVMTKERRVGVELADDLPNYSGHSGKFMLKLIAAWIAMGFRRPEITWGKTLHRAQ
jgi:hypothetical protein